MAMTFSAQTVARCRALVAQINAQGRASGAYDAEREWTAPGGHPVYGAPLRAEDVTAEFLTELPRRSYFFTGWPPDGVTLNRTGAAAWSLLRPFSPVFGARVLARWWHRLQHIPRYDGLPLHVATACADWYARQLPELFRPDADFDGTELDRLALCERLCAMNRLGVLQHLASIDHPMILEIGAGYGMLAAALRRAFPRAAFLIIDLPNSLALSGCYLASRLPGGVSLIDGSSSTIAPGEVGLVLAGTLSAIEGRRIDLAINTLSFGEMAHAVVDSYAAFLRPGLSGTGILFEQNFDNRHTGRGNFCNPTEALERHLREKRRASGFYLKGIPRVWVAS